MHWGIVFAVSFVVLFIILALRGRVWNAYVRSVEKKQGVEIPKPRSRAGYWLRIAAISAGAAGALILLYYFTVWKNLIR
ncbi:hypothetical protein GF359_02820 [candidate division WOR-3 bacterium]|uniref:Uncharacterized protein n=1 Tax=candidate division WOR-3 bacterium TaxID=2052148 RepID=A0A9D5K816_UNCW3|nr:hypothetical protein [candidate division WOR-3 bacterium]MBD3364126.1 hypothetical protein [candidate division WOR-3 bacterium]